MPQDIKSQTDKFISTDEYSSDDRHRTLQAKLLLANKVAVITVLVRLNFVPFNPPQNNDLIAVHRRKLIAKII